MTSVMLRHPYIRYRRGRTRPCLCLCTLCIVGIAETKTFALTAVHPAYACEATTANEPARSQVAELEPWKSRPARSLQYTKYRDIDAVESDLVYT